VDYNTGATASIAEKMLLQSHSGVLILLPAALPGRLGRRGGFKVYIARGGFEFMSKWKNHELVESHIKSTIQEAFIKGPLNDTQVEVM